MDKLYIIANKAASQAKIKTEQPVPIS